MNSNKSIRMYYKKYNLEYFIFIIPMVFLFTLFLIIPFMESIYYSFTNWSGISNHPKFIGLKNYRNIILDNGDFWHSFLFTVKFTFVKYDFNQYCQYRFGLFANNESAV